ncbi:MAG TPA: DUF5719 family protein [Acidimicrobiia bacterium]
MRYAAVLLMFALALGTAFLAAPDPSSPEQAPGTEEPPVAICPVFEVGNQSTSISVLSSINGVGRLSTFAAGEETGSLEFRTGVSGAVAIAAGEAGGVGINGALVEMPSETTAAASVMSGAGSLAAESCADIPTGQAFISGGSTVRGSEFQIQLINPYAGEANVELTVTSEAGIESDDRFNSVIVPALSSRTLDLSQIIPGRERISANIEMTRGSVLAFGRLATEGEVALWRAVAPGEDWWLPVPRGAGTKQMLIATPEAGEIGYQVDLYGPEGLVETHAEGVIEPHGNVVIPLAAVTTEAAGVRVITTGPVVSALRIDSAEGLAWTTGSQVTAPVWLMPGARSPQGGSGSVVVLNAGIETVTVSIRALSDETIVRDLEVNAEEVLVTNLRGAANGYRIEATGPVVALWTSQRDGAGSAAIGIPLQDE